MIRKQVGDEFLVHHAQVVGLAKIDVEKMLADGIPERRVAGFVTHAADFADDRRFKRITMLGDEQEPHQLKHSPIAAVPVIRMQKEAADFAWPIVLFEQ